MVGVTIDAAMLSWHGLRVLTPTQPDCRYMSLFTRLFASFYANSIGTDQAGNQYFEERRARRGRKRRFVSYKGAVDPTAVPAEWHGWLHYTMDAPLPVENRHAWQKPHQVNLTGTGTSYFPPGHPVSGGQRARATGDYEAWTPGS